MLFYTYDPQNLWKSVFIWLTPLLDFLMAKFVFLRIYGEKNPSKLSFSYFNKSHIFLWNAFRKWTYQHAAGLADDCGQLKLTLVTMNIGLLVFHWLQLLSFGPKKNLLNILLSCISSVLAYFESNAPTKQPKSNPLAALFCTAFSQGLISFTFSWRGLLLNPKSD